MKGQNCYKIFEKSIQDYHVMNDVDITCKNPFEENSLESLLYQKNWIDTVQWHLEDIIRDPELKTESFIATKRRIDQSNQHRTDIVESLDDWFLVYFKDYPRKPTAKMNSETLAWLLDRLSILALKVYHMHEQTLREDVDANHINTCKRRLDTLLEQKVDLIQCFDELVEDIKKGDRYVKVYRQMKMYNDTKLNPILYNKK